VIIYPLITLVLHFPVLLLWSFIFRSCIFSPPVRPSEDRKNCRAEISVNLVNICYDERWKWFNLGDFDLDRWPWEIKLTAAQCVTLNRISLTGAIRSDETDWVWERSHIHVELLTGRLCALRHYRRTEHTDVNSDRWCVTTSSPVFRRCPRTRPSWRILKQSQQLLHVFYKPQVPHFHSVFAVLSAVVPFRLAGAKVWNSLPDDVTSAPSLSTFRRHLKTYLFRCCYNTVWYCSYLLWL